MIETGNSTAEARGPSIAAPIVIAYDGSAGSADALALGRQLADAAGRPLALVSVRPPRIRGAAEKGAARDEELWRQAHAVLSAAPIGPEAERHAVCGESVARGLQTFAESERASAIVVGCPERAQTSRIETGSVAQSLLHGAPCAVALAPRGYADDHPQAPQRIVTGYTDSDEARAAVRVAAGLGRACSATVRVVSAFAVPSWSVGLDGYEEAARGDVQAELDAVLRRLASTVSTEGVVLDGDPAQCLLEQADGWADLIVTGSRGYGPKRQVLLGSVSGAVLAAATVPVIVTPRGAETELVARSPAAAQA